MTQAPLPGFSAILKSLVRRRPSSAALALPWHQYGETAGWLSQSAWSLALIAIWRKNCSLTKCSTVWIPDFFCNSSLLALRQTGAKLVFYPLNTDMAPDLSTCQLLADTEPPDIFLLVHYFGQPVSCSAARDFCKRRNAWLVEDAAHVLRPVRGIGTSGDFVLYSPHKSLPLPDGAVLVARPEGPSGLPKTAFSAFGAPESWPQQLSELQKFMGPLVRRSRLRTALWLTKRLLQKLGVASARRTVAPFDEPILTGSIPQASLIEPKQSTLSRHLVGSLIRGLGSIARLRQQNELLWDFRLTGAADNADVLSVGDRSSGWAWTPYLASYRAHIGDAKLIYERLQRQGLPVTTWPDLAPEVLAQPDRHGKALYARQTRFYLPVHQTLRQRDIVGRALLKSHHGQNGLKLVWNQASSDKWMNWLAQIHKSNLLQTWAYGEAKSKESGWRVSRCVFYRGVEPVALVQILQKRIAGVLQVSRINRGPLLLKALSTAETGDMLAQLGMLGNLWRGNLLSMAPELDLTGPNLAMMLSSGFRQFFRGAWQSSWVNLQMETSALRQRLESKWRNVLNFSEKAGLTLEVQHGDQSFAWMIARYRELMQEKKFSGSSAHLLMALRQSVSRDAHLIVLRALHENNAVAGICIARHGASATYLLGWNGDAGRNLKANQYLLWQATLYLKGEGLEWFDLGGIDEEHTPGIASFKLGFGAERYELVGEYWKW
ncbi:MAG: GNAT family N-acetyltransferase [Pseudomonadota bacterium]